VVAPARTVNGDGDFGKLDRNTLEALTRVLAPSHPAAGLRPIAVRTGAHLQSPEGRPCIAGRLS
jgi:hypothetical protein